MVRLRSLACLPLAIGALLALARIGTVRPVAAAAPASFDLRESVRTLLEHEDAALGVPLDERATLRNLYERRGYVPVWLDAACSRGRDSADALALIDAAAADGLDPAAYRRGDLDRRLAAIGRSDRASAADLARFDVVLSVNMLRYLRHLHLGRVNPRAIGFQLSVRPDAHDFALVLSDAAAAHQLGDAAARMRPALRQYDALRSMLARYRSLAADPTLRPPEFPSSVVHPGDGFAAAATLRRWLAAVGDLPPNVTASAMPEYSPDLVDAIQRFQQRHGLETDGVLGKATVAALQVPFAWRARQIESALERLRWLPDFTDAPLVVVNIPMFRLWAWDSAPPTEPPAFTTGVIVGRALNTQTPVFVEQMRQVIFRPYWNVPDSILRGEILPKLARDPQYLRRQNMEMVREWDDDARAIDGGEGSVQALRRGELRVRQRPGPQNSLGLVKFVFPNTNNVYMHGTPAKELFARSRRDFSHGCVRVEDPLTLAEWALRGEPEWSREAIQAAMGGARTITVTLRRPIQVILFYTTATVMPEDGTVHFADDIYRHDARLDQSLGDRTGSPTMRR